MPARSTHPHTVCMVSQVWSPFRAQTLPSPAVFHIRFGCVPSQVALSTTAMVTCRAICPTRGHTVVHVRLACVKAHGRPPTHSSTALMAHGSYRRQHAHGTPHTVPFLQELMQQYARRRANLLPFRVSSRASSGGLSNRPSACPMMLWLRARNTTAWATWCPLLRKDATR